VIEHVKDSGDEDFLLNKLIEITRVGQFEVRDISVTAFKRSQGSASTRLNV
jgi:hypothetical protein